MIQTYRAISSWTLAFPGYLHNQRYPYVEVVIRINLISDIASYTPHPKPSFLAPPVAPSPQTAAMPWATRPSPPPLQRPCWRTPRRDTSRREGTNTIATDHLRFEYTISGKLNMDVDVLKKMDMWKTYSCHNMYLVVLSYIFGKRWWLSCNCTRSDTRRDVASLSIIPYRLTALQARKPDEWGNSAWNGWG